MEAEQIRADAAQLAEFGYKQQLTRALGLWSNFSLGFTYLSPVVGVYTLFAFGLATAGPAYIWTIPHVVAGQMLVVLTFGEVASRYPIAGGIYQWSKQLLGDKYAWFAGWYYAWALLVTVAARFVLAPHDQPLARAPAPQRPFEWSVLVQSERIGRLLHCETAQLQIACLTAR